MKKTVLLVALLVVISFSTQAQDIVVDKPAFRSSNQTFIEVDKVTIGDAETALKMIGYHHPGWWIKVVDTTYIEANGKHYTLKRAEGIELNAEVPTNENGEIHFTLFFDAIPKNTKEITLNEDGSIINGIQLLPKTAWRTPVPQDFLDAATTIVEDGKPLPTPQLIDGEATVKGQIAGYTDDMKLSLQFYVNNPIVYKQEKYECKVNDDGSFECEIPLVSISSVFIHAKNMLSESIVLTPYEETHIYFDLEQKSCQEARLRHDKCEKGRCVYFAGANAELNNQLKGKEIGNYWSKHEGFYERAVDDIIGMDAIQFRDYLYAKEKNQLADIEQLSVTQKMKEYLFIIQKYGTFHDLCLGRLFLENAYRKAHNGNTDDFESPVFDKEYYAYIKELQFNNLKLLYSTLYYNMISSIARLDDLLSISTNRISDQILNELIKQPFYSSEYDDVIEYLKNDFPKIEPEKLKEYHQRHKVILNALIDADKLKGKSLALGNRILAMEEITTNKDFDDYTNLLTNLRYEANKVISDSLLMAELGVECFHDVAYPLSMERHDSLFHVKVGEFLEKEEISSFIKPRQTLDALGNRTTIFKEITGIKEGICYDFLLAQNIANDFEEMIPLSQSDLDFYSNYFDHPFFIPYLTRINNELLAEIEKNKKNPYNVHEMPEVAEEQLLHEILKPHEGKVIFVDFWNTWCGPCRDAMKKFADTKESYKDKEVVFVYLADESSPEAAWNNMIATIGGEHYRLTSEQMDYLGEKFKIRGIPSYVIFNKRGEQVYFRTGFEGAQKLSEILDKHLAE